MADTTRADTPDLTPYQLPIADMPESARVVHAAGIRRSEFPGVEHARAVLLTDRASHPDGVLRSEDGRALILCTTQLPGVSPALMDWWFGWHLPASARYRLWHPRAHLKARVQEDRSHLTNDRARYIGNVSYVDEYIGAALSRLAIEFQPPEQFGFPDLDALRATAICALTVDRLLSSEGGSLVHLIVPNSQGSELRSAFWLGTIDNRIPALGPLVTRIVNRAFVRKRVITDRFLLDLFQHCAEEMNHLPRFLPRLHADVQRRAQPATSI